MSELTKSLLRLLGVVALGAVIGAIAHYTILAGKDKTPMLLSMVGVFGSVAAVRLRRKISGTENPRADWVLAVVGACLMMGILFFKK